MVTPTPRITASGRHLRVLTGVPGLRLAGIRESAFAGFHADLGVAPTGREGQFECVAIRPPRVDLPVAACPVAQPRRSSPNRAQLSSMAVCAAGEMVPMSKKPWIIPSYSRTSASTPAARSALP